MIMGHLRMVFVMTKGPYSSPELASQLKSPQRPISRRWHTLVRTIHVHVRAAFHGKLFCSFI